MPKFRYPVRPLEHMMATQFGDASIPGGYSPVTKNVRVYRNGVRKRWGYTSDRALGAMVYGTACLQAANGQRYTVYLTSTDFAVRKTGTSETFAYATDTYTTGTASLSGTTLTGAGGAAWVTGGIEAGDKFIFTADQSANIEPDTNWATVSSVDSETGIKLTASYTGATASGAYKIRKVYSVPTNERWSWAMVDDKFVFTNGAVNTQYMSAGGTYATDVNSTYAIKAKYCTSFADRLILADVYSGGLRNPVKVQYSANTNVLQFDSATDSTAGSFEVLDTDGYITGLSTAGSFLTVYKMNSVNCYGRTGISTSPLELAVSRPGVGCVAPYSIVSAMGTNFWLGKDDFYLLDGDYPRAVGENIRYKFYDLVGETEAQYTWGFVNPTENEIVWVANTSEGKYGFAWDYKYKEWTLYQFPVDITGAGDGAV